MTPSQTRRLEESLRLPASSAESQVADLDALGTSGSLDELALELDDRFGPLAAELDEVAPAVAAACRAVEQALSADKLAWTPDALTTSGWQDVRSLAEEAVLSLRRSGMTHEETT